MPGSQCGRGRTALDGVGAVSLGGLVPGGPVRAGSGGGVGCDAGVGGRFFEADCAQDSLVGGAGCGAPPGGARRSGERAEVHLVELAADVGPRVVGAGLDDPDLEECEPAQDDSGSDAVFEPVVDGPEVQRGFNAAPASFDFEELFVTQRDVFDGQ